MRLLAVLALAALAAASAQTIPQFPTTWNSQYGNRVIIFQGGSFDPVKNLGCCSNTAGDCKVQTEAVGGQQYVDGTAQNIGLVAGNQGDFQIYSTNQDMAVQKSTTVPGAWDCQSYCPLQDSEWGNPLAFPTTASFVGKELVDNKVYDHWTWNDGIGPIKMDQQDWWVDSNGTVPAPYTSAEELTPFNGAEIGASYQSFRGFQQGLNDFSFTVTNAASCTLNDQCGDNGKGSKVLKSRLAENKMKEKSKLDVMMDAVQEHRVNKHKAQRQNKVEANSGDVNTSFDVVFPNDWVATETNGIVIAQNAFKPSNAQTCCVSNYSNQCQVQIEYNSATHFYDYTNQRERFESAGQPAQVNLYKGVFKAIQTKIVNDAEVCDYYCPIPTDDSLGTGNEYFLDPSAVYMGQVKYKGKYALQWQWNATFPVLNLTMEYTNFFTGLDYTPITALTYLTPFGQLPPIGTETTAWGANFTPGTPSPAKFNISGIDTCPVDPQGCNQNNKLIKRLSSRKGLTFFKV